MKLNGISLNIQHDDEALYLETDPHEMGDAHIMTSIDTPLRKDAFDLSDAEKKVEIEKHFRSIMHILG